MFKKIFKPAISLVIICIVTSTLLGLTNYITKDKIAEADEKASLEAQNIVLGYTADDKLDFKNKDVTVDGKKYTLSYGYKDGKLLGCAVKASSNGYGGTVSVMTGIDNDGSVLQIDVLDVSNETAGMGQNATKTSFTDQFKKLKSNIGVSKSTPSDNEIKAMTGATITSTAVTDAVNAALKAYSKGNVGGEN